MTLKEFLSKELVEEGVMLVSTGVIGCRYLLIENQVCQGESHHLINGGPYYNYIEFWNKFPNWKVLYKYNP